MTVALRTATPTIALPDPTLTPLERVILDEHPVELVTRATDVENECEHGNLPFDPNLDCECWTRARTAALLGQAPIDDGCPGLDRAAVLDLSIPPIEVPGQAPDLQPAADQVDDGLAPMTHGIDWWQDRIARTFGDNRQEERMDSSNGTEPTTEPTTQEIHAWYMGEDERTLSDVCDHFNLSRSTLARRFDDADLSAKPRGGGRRGESPEGPAIAQQPPVPETPIEGIAAAVVVLQREREQLAERLLRVDMAIETVRELAA